MRVVETATPAIEFLKSHIDRLDFYIANGSMEGSMDAISAISSDPTDYHRFMVEQRDLAVEALKGLTPAVVHGGP